MKQQLGAVALECLFDLGVTVVYAMVAGFLIVAIVASDQGAISIFHAALYALLLPAAALALIASEIGLRLCKEWRNLRLSS